MTYLTLREKEVILMPKQVMSVYDIGENLRTPMTSIGSKFGTHRSMRPSRSVWVSSRL